MYNFEMDKPAIEFFKDQANSAATFALGRLMGAMYNQGVIDHQTFMNVSTYLITDGQEYTDVRTGKKIASTGSAPKSE